ncbi:MAG: helical backbone metal receptor [Sphaerochaetaceae bacterium]|nr:helical backbone metal receptor [Sphaerochaetaceae bacterium]
MKKVFITLLVFVLCFAVFAQSGSEKSSSSDLRIVSLAPNVTEILCALGCEENLVGRTDYCDYPESVASIPSIGTLYDPNLEAILALEPDVVIASSIVDPDFIASLKAAGVEAYQFLEESNGLDGTYNLIEEVGEAVGKKKEATKLASSVKKRIEKVEKLTDDVEEKSCIYIISWGDWGDYAATGETYLDDLIEAAGAENAAEEASNWSISRELLLSEDPDYIILPVYAYSDPNQVEAFKSTAPYSQLTGTVITIDGNAAERQGLRSADTVEAIAKALYPELF